MMADNQYLKDVNAKSKRLDLMTDEELAALHKWQDAPKWQDQKGDEPIKAARQERDVVLAPPPGMGPMPKAKTSVLSDAYNPTDEDEDKFTFSETPKPGAKGEDEFSFTTGSSKRSKKDDGPSFPAQVSRVVDGDTFVANVNGNQVTVRISKMDAPELGPGRMGADSKEALEKLLASGQVKISNIEQDKHGRLVANVTVGDVDAATWMKQSGYATSWLGQPEGWPRGNEFRQIWKSMPMEDQLRFRPLVAWMRKFGLLARAGRRPTPEQIEAFQEEAKPFMEKYVNPGRQPQSRGPMPQLKTPGLTPPPAAQAPAAPARSPDEPMYMDRPNGKSEWSSWEKTLNPKEKQLYSDLINGIHYLETHAPRVGRQKYLQSDQQYLYYKKMYEKLLHLTTQRWRKFQQSQPPAAPAGRRRRRAELSEDGMEALGAVA